MGRGESWWCSGGMGLWVMGFVWLLLLLLCVCVCVCVCVFVFSLGGGVVFVSDVWWYLVVCVFVCVCVCVFFLLVVLVGGFGGFFNGFASWHSGGMVVVAGWCLVG